ncbi:BQ5605_C038g11691 [Microbotryum silenes-dioicae]|uniref:BQ5605_C038g11691 protein n=1 Tax=Microbotryum silenes-dioicae TaxID=796604 RepID=A0A2X0PGN4_9BASI|nr:BQ5605_C038g11691 [Microbotryum silenes-dioicae]
MNQLQVKYKGDRPPIALRQQSSPEPYLSDDESDSYEDEDDSKLSAALVAVPPKSSMSRTSSASGIRQAIHTTESKKTDQRRHYLTTSSPHHSWLGKTRRFGPVYLRALSAERRRTNCRTRSAEAFLSNIIFTTAEHNELRLRPLVPRKQKSDWKFTHDWAPRKYECCLAVVERPYGKAPSSTHHQQPQPAKVDLLWRFCGWPSLLGGLQKRSDRSTAMIIQAKVCRCRSVTY